MVSRGDGIPAVQAVSGDRPGGSGFGLLEGARPREVELRPVAESAGAAQTLEAGENFKAQLQAQDARLSFEKDEASGKMVVRLKDSKTGKVIRQIPPEEMLRVARAIDQYLGLLIDHHS